MIDCTVDFISAMKTDKTHDFLDLFNGLTLKILCKTAMGLDIDFEDPKAKQYRDDVERIKARSSIKLEKTLRAIYIIFSRSTLQVGLYRNILPLPL